MSRDRRDAIRSGTLPDPLGWALALGVVALAAALAAGCSERKVLRPITHVVGPGAIAHVGTAGGAPSVVVLGAIDDHLLPGLPPGSWRTTPRGVRVWVPSWLRLAPDLLAEAMREIDETIPQGAGSHPRIPASARGTPAGVQILIQDPGSFSTAYSPTRLARGLTDMRSWIRVSWRVSWAENRPLLPALAHELGHVWSGDPDLGH